MRLAGAHPQIASDRASWPARPVAPRPGHLFDNILVQQRYTACQSPATGNAQFIGLPLNRYTDSLSKAPSRNSGLPKRKTPLQGLLLCDCKFQAVALWTMTSCLAQRFAKRAVVALRSTVESACALIALDGRVKPHLDHIDGRHRGLTGMPSHRFCEN